MNWEKKSAMYIDSDCKRFRICKAFVHGAPVYQAATLGAKGWEIVLGRGSLDEAKQACEEAAK